jgi:nucleoside triphosphate diphosphatase
LDLKTNSLLKRLPVAPALLQRAMADATGDKRYALSDLLAVMARLRDKDTGCPWDVEQTFSTIAPYTIEEAYEVAEAIEHDDLDALKDELGDLLLQVVYHAQMAWEEQRFGFADVVDAITRKMLRRHPHVFGSARRDEFLSGDMWRRIKDEEKAERGAPAPFSRLDDVPLALPALTRAVKLQERAADVGFDWPSLGPVLAKAEEEIAELKAAIAESEGEKSRMQRVVEEFGDLLFVMANIARHLGVDPEAALRGANTRFARRFRSIEAALAKDGRKPEDATLEEMDALWDEAKAAEGKD